MTKDPELGEIAKEELKALFEQGQKYQYGKDDVEEDAAKSFEYYLQAAECDYGPAMLAVAEAYHYGRGVQEDPVKAFAWYERAADNCDDLRSCLEAKVELGKCFESGYGVDKDLNKACETYLEAADYGYCVAEYHVGRCYHFGIGVEQSLKNAYEFYKRALENGYEFAKQKIKELKKRGFNQE